MKAPTYLLLFLWLTWCGICFADLTNFFQPLPLSKARGDIDYPRPRIVILGETGVGKSSLADALLGCDPLASDCTFTVCSEMESCTNQTKAAIGGWLGQGTNFTIVDTPGFGDTGGLENQNRLIEEMMDVLNENLGYANGLLLLVKGTETRFNAALQNMLHEMTALFGSSMWDFTMVGVSFWKYSQEEIDRRNKTCTNYPDRCKNEAWFQDQINQQLHDKFHVDINLPFAFIDSFSQIVDNQDDPVQQKYFLQESSKLWEFATMGNDFEFMTIDDILADYEHLKEENRWLKDVIATNISELASRLDATDAAVEENKQRNDEQDQCNAEQDAEIEATQKRIDDQDATIKQNSDDITYEHEYFTDRVNDNSQNIVANNLEIFKNTDNLNQLNARLTGSETSITFLKSNQESLQSHQETLLERMQAAETTIDYHDSNQKSLLQKMPIAENKISAMETRLGKVLSTKNCQKSGWVNSFDAAFDYVCPGNKQITGVHSVHDNGKEDRVFEFTCCDVYVD